MDPRDEERRKQIAEGRRRAEVEEKEAVMAGPDDDILAKMRASVGAAAPSMPSAVVPFMSSPLSDEDDGEMPLPEEEGGTPVPPGLAAAAGLAPSPPQTPPGGRRARRRAHRQQQQQAAGTPPAPVQQRREPVIMGAAIDDSGFAQALGELQGLNNNVTIRLIRQNALGQRETVGFWRERPVEDAINAEEWIPEWSGGGSYQLQVSVPGASKKVIASRIINLPGDPIDPANIRQRREQLEATKAASAAILGQPPAAAPAAPSTSPADPGLFGGDAPRSRSHYEPRASVSQSQEDIGMSRLLEKLIDARLGSPVTDLAAQQEQARQREQERREWEKRLDDERKLREQQRDEDRKAREAQEREWQRQREEDRKAREEDARLAREQRMEEERKRHEAEMARERERREEDVKRREHDLEEKIAREREKAAADLRDLKASFDAKANEFKASFDRVEEERKRHEDEMRRREDELKRQHDQALAAAKEQHTQTLAAIDKKQNEDKLAGIMKDFQTQVLGLIDKMNVAKVDPATTSQAELFKLLTVLMSKDDGRGDMMKTLLEVLSPERSLAAMESVAKLSTASSDAVLGILKSGVLDQLTGSAPQSPWIPFIEKLVDGLGAVAEAGFSARAANAQQQQAAAAALAASSRQGGGMALPGLPPGQRPPVPAPFSGPPAAPPRTVRLPDAPVAPPRPVPAPVQAAPAASAPAAHRSEAAVPLAKIGNAIVANAESDQVAQMLVDYVLFMYKFDMLPPQAEEAVFNQPGTAVPQLLATALSLVPNAPQALEEAYVSAVIDAFVARLHEAMSEEEPDNAGPGNGDEPVASDATAAAVASPDNGDGAAPEAEPAAPEASADDAPATPPEPAPEPPSPPPTPLPRRAVRRS